MSTQVDPRHQLEQNELGKLALRSEDFLDRYGKTLLISLVAAVSLAAAYAMWSSSAASRAAESWSRLAEVDLGGPQDTPAKKFSGFEQVAEKYAGTLAGAWAKLRAAELLLETGFQDTFTNRELATTDLGRAKSMFEAVLAGSPTSPMIKERALLGLARQAEMTCDGDTGTAVAAFEKLKREFPASGYKSYADERIAALGQAGTQEFYRWFHKQNPKPAGPSKPRDGRPSIPGLNLPDGFEDSFFPPPKPSGAMGTDAEPADELPVVTPAADGAKATDAATAPTNTDPTTEDNNEKTIENEAGKGE